MLQGNLNSLKNQIEAARRDANEKKLDISHNLRKQDEMKKSLIKMSNRLRNNERVLLTFEPRVENEYDICKIVQIRFLKEAWTLDEKTKK